MKPIKPIAFAAKPVDSSKLRYVLTGAIIGLVMIACQFALAEDGAKDTLEFLTLNGPAESLTLSEVIINDDPFAIPLTQENNEQLKPPLVTNPEPNLQTPADSVPSVVETAPTLPPPAIPGSLPPSLVPDIAPPHQNSPQIQSTPQVAPNISPTLPTLPDVTAPGAVCPREGYCPLFDQVVPRAEVYVVPKTFVPSTLVVLPTTLLAPSVGYVPYGGLGVDREYERAYAELDHLMDDIQRLREIQRLRSIMLNSYRIPSYRIPYGYRPLCGY